MDFERTRNKHDYLSKFLISSGWGSHRCPQQLLQLEDLEASCDFFFCENCFAIAASRTRFRTRIRYLINVRIPEDIAQGCWSLTWVKCLSIANRKPFYIQWPDGREDEQPGVAVCLPGWGQVTLTWQHESEFSGQRTTAIDDTFGFRDNQSLPERVWTVKAAQNRAS